MSTQAIKDFGNVVKDFSTKYILIRATLFVLAYVTTYITAFTVVGPLFKIGLIIGALYAFKDGENYGIGAAVYIAVIILTVPHINEWSVNLFYTIAVMVLSIWLIYIARKSHVFLGVGLAVILACAMPFFTHILYDQVPSEGLSVSDIVDQRGL